MVVIAQGRVGGVQEVIRFVVTQTQVERTDKRIKAVTTINVQTACLGVMERPCARANATNERNHSAPATGRFITQIPDWSEINRIPNDGKHGWR